MDNLTSEQRSARMAKIRGDDLKPESRLRAALTDAGVFFWTNRPDLPGKPDVTIAGEKCRLAVFVHGCFWHGCPEHYKTPKTRAAHWDAHVGKNKRRDRRVRRALNRLGYRTAVVWEHDLKTEAKAAKAAERVRRLCRL